MKKMNDGWGIKEIWKGLMMDKSELEEELKHNE